MIDIDFLPPSFHQECARRRRIRREGILVVIVALVLVVAGTTHHHHGQRLRERLDAAHTEVELVHDQMRQMVALERQEFELAEQFRLQQMLGAPLPTSSVLAVLSHLLPQPMALTALTISTARPEAASARGAAAKRGNDARAAAGPAPHQVLHIELTGISPDDVAVANLVGRLSAHPLLTNVKMLYCQAAEFDGRAMREFRIRLAVRLDRHYRAEEQNQEPIAHAD